MSTAATQQSEPQLRFDAFQKCFVRGDQRVPGLLPLLAARFYPHYSYTKAKFNRQHSDVTEYQQRQAKKKKHARAIGVDIGMLLDKQISATVDVFKHFPNAPLRTFWDREFLRAALLPPWAKQVCKDVMPQTRAFWKALDALKLRPVDTQVAVEHQHKGRHYATAVDVVCINKAGEYILVECKSGFTGYYKCCTAKMMSAPLQCQTDSLANQHQIQLAATKEMYQRTFPDRVVGECVILHVEGTKVSRYSLKPWATRVRSWAELLF